MPLEIFTEGDRDEWYEGYQYAHEVWVACRQAGLAFSATLGELRDASAHTVNYVRDGIDEYIDELLDVDDEG